MNIFEKIGTWVVAAVGLSIIVPLIVAPLAALDGWIISKMWAWFVTPLFPVPALHVWMAAGLALTVRMFCRTTPEGCEDKRTLGAKIVATILPPLYILLFGWIIHRWLI